MRILVTGGSGYLGSELARQARAQGWEVAARIECEPPGHTRFYMTKKLS